MEQHIHNFPVLSSFMDFFCIWYVTYMRADNLHAIVHFVDVVRDGSILSSAYAENVVIHLYYQRSRHHHAYIPQMTSICAYYEMQTKHFLSSQKKRPRDDKTIERRQYNNGICKIHTPHRHTLRQRGILIYVNLKAQQAIYAHFGRLCEWLPQQCSEWCVIERARARVVVCPI